MLAILCHSGNDNCTVLVELGAVDTLLNVVAAYKRRDPVEGEEVEMLENAWGVLGMLVESKNGKAAFLEAEGLELLILLIKSKKMCRMGAVKVLDLVLAGESHTVCLRWVEIFGLKTLFSLFMRKGIKAYKKAYPHFSEIREDEYVLSAIFSLFKNLSAVENTEEYTRLIGKFEEEDFEKVDRLIELHFSFMERVNADVNDEENIDEDEDEDEVYLKKLDRGLFALQLVDLVVASLVKSVDDEEIISKKAQILDRINMLLERSGSSMTDIKSVVE
ncbi:hypothetical protein HK096_000670, partial [Nowakowskiella sp. JEL0078]